MKQKYLLLLLLLAVFAAACANYKDLVITSPDFSKIADGTYRGDSKIGPVLVTLDVTIQNGTIGQIQIIRHRNGRGKKAEAIVPRIIEAQSLEVDVISGATASSKAFLQAVENALAGK